MALLLLRHALNFTNDDGDDDDASTVFSVSVNANLRFYSYGGCEMSCFSFSDICFDDKQLFLLRAAGFLLPFYIVAWAIGILQRRRQRQVA